MAKECCKRSSNNHNCKNDKNKYGIPWISFLLSCIGKCAKTNVCKHEGFSTRSCDWKSNTRYSFALRRKIVPCEMCHKYTCSKKTNNTWLLKRFRNIIRNHSYHQQQYCLCNWWMNQHSNWLKHKSTNKPTDYTNKDWKQAKLYKLS